MNLTTKDRYFELFPEASSSTQAKDLAKINMRIAAVSANVERFLGRYTQESERTEKFTPDCGTGTKQIRLKAFPIASITSVSSYDTTLIEDEDYLLNDTDGVIHFAYPIVRQEPLYERKISVTYVGGMAEDTADFISKYPDIELEVLTQINFEIKRVNDIAMKSVSNGQSSSSLNPYGFLDSLVTVLNRYKVLAGP